MIVIHQEPAYMRHVGCEVCYFCKTPTRAWDKTARYPVCKTCAKNHKEEDLKWPTP